MAKREAKELIVRQQRPDNLEGPDEVFDLLKTPVERFFVRSHFDVPDIDPESWSVSVEGSVEQPRSWDLDELQNFDGCTTVATLECAGNGRARLGDRSSGVPWQKGAVGTAEWGGVPLDRLLEEVGLEDDVEQLVFVGADRGRVETDDGASIEMPYARGLPVEMAMSGDVLVATQMDGEPLTKEHGYPARLLVPGWYGMASVKWLERIVAITDQFEGYFQTEDYAIWEFEDALPVRQPLGSMAVKSHIGTPTDGRRLVAGQTVTIEGFAWGGKGELECVEVSVDGGDTYRAAELDDSSDRHAWRRFSYTWEVPESPGEVTLCSRACTDEGEIQPEDHDWKKGSYAVNMIRPVRAVVATPE